MLIKLATAAFKKASWPTSIQTGRYMYPLANNSRNVGLAIADGSITHETRRKALREICKELEHGGPASSIKIELVSAE
jgi:hypothetical protein